MRAVLSGGWILSCEGHSDALFLTDTEAVIVMLQAMNEVQT
jgi:hypothetical protein